MKSLESAKSQFRQILLLLAGFSFVVNMLMLTMPLYMLQIYDRILPAQSLDTLTFLSIIAVGALVVLGLLEAVRAVLASRAAARMESVLGADALRVSMLKSRLSEANIQPMRDLAIIRNFVSSRMVFFPVGHPFCSDIYWNSLYHSSHTVLVDPCGNRGSFLDCHSQPKANRRARHNRSNPPGGSNDECPIHVPQRSCSSCHGYGG